MPLYLYRCNECQSELEARHSIHDNALTICPKCKGNIERIISSNVGISFKGDGFHINDYNPNLVKKESGAKTAAAPPVATKDSAPTGG